MRTKIIKKISYGVFSTVIDLLLWQVALVGSSIGKTGSRGVYQAFQEADDFLQKINHRTIISTWHQLIKKNLVSYKRRKNLYSPIITKFGQERLKSIFPQYHKERPWDKRIFLIIYDVPEKARIKRDKLRYFLYQINARSLQESTFLTPYNPHQLLLEFINKCKIPGTIIISDIGPDGGIGESTIQDLLVKLYNLDQINERYERFLKHAKENINPPRFLIFEYLSILREDPQLPFSLLPSGWLGEEAYILCEKIKLKYVNAYAAT